MSRVMCFRDKYDIINNSDITDFEFVKKFKNQGKQGVVGILLTYQSIYFVKKSIIIVPGVKHTGSKSFTSSSVDIALLNRRWRC